MSTDLVQATRTAGSLPEKMEYARALAASGMIPAAYKQQPANVLVAIEYGEALGIKPIVAISEINVISGTPSPSASLMASLARAAGHRVRTWNDETDGAGICEIVRCDDPEFTHRSRWDEAKARQAGYWGKGHWAKDPQTMLRWRAISECVRLACPEVLGGLRYTPEEVMEMEESRSPRRVESEQVQQSAPAAIAEPAAPAAEPVPADMAARIAASEDADGLRKLADFLPRKYGDTDEVADLLLAISQRIEVLTAPAEAEPESELPLDAELVPEAVAS